MSTVGESDWPEGPAVPLDLIWNRASPDVHDAKWRHVWNSAQSAVGVPEIPVTEEMVAAAQACWTTPTFPGYSTMWREIYRAMAAVAPVDLYTTNVAESARIAALEADNAALTKALAELSQQARNVTAAAFTADQPDLPDPPRRPDGTLMPQPKALTLPRETGDKRRIGG